jgi:hypothetical protein
MEAGSLCVLVCWCASTTHVRTFQQISRLVLDLNDRRLLGGRGTELIREAACALVHQFSTARYALPATIVQTHTLARLAGDASKTTPAKNAKLLLQSWLTEHIVHTCNAVQDAALQGLKSFAAAYYVLTDKTKAVCSRCLSLSLYLIYAHSFCLPIHPLTGGAIGSLVGWNRNRMFARLLIRIFVVHDVIDYRVRGVATAWVLLHCRELSSRYV